MSNCFERLSFFNVINGFPPDLMHDYLEGTLVYNFGFLMNRLIKNNILSFDKFINVLNDFKYERKDKKNKISKNQFTKFALTTPKGFHLSGTHFWALIRIFLLIFGDLLKNNVN